jgi:hypothetical protein
MTTYYAAHYPLIDGGGARREIRSYYGVRDYRRAQKVATADGYCLVEVTAEEYNEYYHKLRQEEEEERLRRRIEDCAKVKEAGLRVIPVPYLTDNGGRYLSMLEYFDNIAERHSPLLVGSEKQIAWANRLRDGFAVAARPVLSDIDRMVLPGLQADGDYLTARETSRLKCNYCMTLALHVYWTNDVRDLIDYRDCLWSLRPDARFCTIDYSLIYQHHGFATSDERRDLCKVFLGYAQRQIDYNRRYSLDCDERHRVQPVDGYLVPPQFGGDSDWRERWLVADEQAA